MKILLIGRHSYIANKFYIKFSDTFHIDFLEKEYKNADVKHFVSYDIVLNFAAIVHKKGITDKQYNKVNKDLAVYLASISKQANVKQFIQMSSIAVYGDVEKVDIDTECHPKTAYGKSKLEADKILLSMGDSLFKVAVVRPPIIYGKDAPGNMNSLIRLISTGIPLPFQYKDNKRSTLYIDNLLFLLKSVIDTKSSGVFLARDQEIPSIYELSECIKQSLNRKNIIFPLPKILIHFLIKIKWLPFNKVYGNMFINDSETVDRLGPYQQVSYMEGIKQTCGTQ